MRFCPNSPRSLLLALGVAGACAAACTGNIGGQQMSGGGGVSGAGNTTGGGNTTGAGNNVGTGTGNSVGTGTGNIGGPTAETCAQVGMDTGAATLRRLSNLEYQLTLQDLFQLGAAPAVDSIPPDVDHHGFRTYAAIQSVSAQHLRAYIDRAHALADELMADTARRTRVLGCEPTASGCLRAFVGRFGRLAYRRPLETVEQDTIISRATADALDATDQFRFAIEVMLSAPSFLYRVEVGSAADAVATLGPYELASRLAFALWGRAPDAALLDQAASGALGTPAGLEAAAATMLADGRAKSYYQAFFRQWLGFEGITAPPNPPAAWSAPLLADMTRETSSVIDDFAWGQRDFLGVLTASYTRPTPALSTYFGVPAAAADGTATFPAGHARAGTGLLTHPSLLAAKRDGDLIAMRGNWLRSTFFCKTLTIDPNVAETLGEMLVGLTRVQIVQKRNTEATCKGCHALIDPIGIGFAQFDQTGRFDATLDPSIYGVAPALPDATANPGFTTVADLATKLQAMPEVTACLASKLFTYTEGREPVRADTCAVESATKGFAAGGNDFALMLKGLITAPSFRQRRAAGATP
jgi:hypothetical protein